MEQRRLFKDEQMRFAESALTLRYPEPGQAGMAASQLLNCRRPEDAGDDLYSTLNRVQLCGAPHNWTYVERAFM